MSAMRSLRPQSPPRDATTELLEWAITVLITSVALSFCWLVAELLS